MSRQQPTTSRSSADLVAFLATLGTDTGGDDRAANSLLPTMYVQLRTMAQSLLRSESTNHTLQPTALVHEVYLKLVGQGAVCWRDRGHFLAVACQAMRRILIDHARGKHRLKRGGGERIVMLSEVCPVSPQRDIDLVALDDAMQRLEKDDPMDARIVEMRFFGGLDVAEIAKTLGVSAKTVQRRWNYARAWLYRELTSRETRSEQVNGQ